MKKRSGIQVMAGLIGMVKPLAGYMLLAIFTGMAGHLSASFITILAGYSVLKVMGLNLQLSLSAIFAAMVFLAAARGLLRYAEQSCNHFIAFKLLALIRDKVFQSLRRLCPAKLEGKDRGNLISVITSDIELLEVFYAHTISPIVIAICFCFFMCLFIGHFHPALGLVALAAYIVVGFFIPMMISKFSGDLGICFREKSGQLSSFVLDSLRGLYEIQQYGMGKRRLEEMNRRTDELSEDEEQMKRISGRNNAITQTAVLLFDLLMLFTAMSLYRKGTLETSGMLLSVLALMSSFGPAVALANLGSTLQNTFAAGNRVLDILEETPVVEDVSGKPEIGFTGAAASHVSFSYGSETILSDVSVKIPEHAVIGICGRSGSGKSTLLKLLMRFWSTDQGEILISEKNIEEINTSNLRNMESFVTQETHLFHDSIKNNLRIARWNATEEEMQEACQKAGIHDFIRKLPRGYDTEVGELGDTLSGGERQRIGLARAFLHDAPLMLLDEPTSNLDSLNEALILKSLHEERKGKTVVLVSHRQSTMGIADRIYSVGHGRIS